MTVQENIQVVPELLKWKKGEKEKRTDELLDMVGLDPSIFKKDIQASFREDSSSVSVLSGH